MDAQGCVVTPLSDDDIHRLVDEIANGFRAQSVAVCLLHAYANPAHEQRIAQAFAARHPDIRVSLSSVVSSDVYSITICFTFIFYIVGRYVGRLIGLLEMLTVIILLVIPMITPPMFMF